MPHYDKKHLHSFKFPFTVSNTEYEEETYSLIKLT